MVNNKQEIFKGITSRAKSLLAREAGLDVEFKQAVDALAVEDLVAFANSAAGGSILIGVADAQTTDASKAAKDQIMGCAVDDEAKRGLIAKADSCVPPIHIDLFVENVGDRPFIRIEIPSGDNKPYATSSGVYTTRSDGKTNPLFPDRLVSLLMDIKSQDFLQKFQSAGRDLGDNLAQINNAVTEQFAKILQNIQNIGTQMETGIQGITWRAQDAQKDSDKYNQEVRDLANTVSEIQKKLETLQSGIEFLDANLLHLLSHFNVEDEKERTAREQMVHLFKKKVEQVQLHYPGISKDRLMEALTMHYPNATIQSLTQIYETIYSDGNKQTEQ